MPQYMDLAELPFIDAKLKRIFVKMARADANLSLHVWDRVEKIQAERLEKSSQNLQRKLGLDWQQSAFAIRFDDANLGQDIRQAIRDIAIGKFPLSYGEYQHLKSPCA